jgi:hypothetical protein
MGPIEKMFRRLVGSQWKPPPVWNLKDYFVLEFSDGSVANYDCTLLVFSTEETVRQHLENFRIQGATPKKMTWNEIDKKWGQCFDGAMVDWIGLGMFAEGGGHRPFGD